MGTSNPPRGHPGPGEAGESTAPHAGSTAVVGLQWGDEGKGKVIDLIAGGFDAVVRFNGGANAGHSVVVNGRRHALHLLPSAVHHPRVKGVIANGVVVDPAVLLEEIDGLAALGVPRPNLALSDRAHVVLPYHKEEDALRETVAAAADAENDRSIGTTRRGIGPAYSDKALRSTAVRVGDLLKPAALREKIERACAIKNPQFQAMSERAQSFDPALLSTRYLEFGERLRPYITDTFQLLRAMLDDGRHLLFEGANATLLDVDHGTFPYVTASNCTSLGIPAGTGVPGRLIASVVGVMKAYCTRVGAGPFPTEQNNAVGERIRKRGNEYGTTTGRPRRCGWLDLVALRYAVRLNDLDSIALMLLDVLSGFDEIKICTAYRVSGARIERFLPDADSLTLVEPIYETLPGWSEDISGARALDDLPSAARRYVQFVEEHAGAPVRIVSVGPDREQTIAPARGAAAHPIHAA